MADQPPGEGAPQPDPAITEAFWNEGEDEYIDNAFDDAESAALCYVSLPESAGPNARIKMLRQAIRHGGTFLDALVKTSQPQVFAEHLKGAEGDWGDVFAALPVAAQAAAVRTCGDSPETRQQWAKCCSRDVFEAVKGMLTGRARLLWSSCKKELGGPPGKRPDATTAPAVETAPLQPPSTIQPAPIAETRLPLAVPAAKPGPAPSTSHYSGPTTTDPQQRAGPSGGFGAAMRVVRRPALAGLGSVLEDEEFDSGGPFGRSEQSSRHLPGPIDGPGRSQSPDTFLPTKFKPAQPAPANGTPIPPLPRKDKHNSVPSATVSAPQRAASKLPAPKPPARSEPASYAQSPQATPDGSDVPEPSEEEVQRGVWHGISNGPGASPGPSMPGGAAGGGDDEGNGDDEDDEGGEDDGGDEDDLGEDPDLDILNPQFKKSERFGYRFGISGGLGPVERMSISQLVGRPHHKRLAEMEAEKTRRWGDKMLSLEESLRDARKKGYERAIETDRFATSGNLCAWSATIRARGTSNGERAACRANGFL